MEDSAAKGWLGLWRLEARKSWGEAGTVSTWENLDLGTIGMPSAEELSAKAPGDWLPATAAAAVAGPVWASSKTAGASQTSLKIARSFIKHL